MTKTNSGDGCGTDWPLCNGKFVPAYTVESFIEYSHRLVSGIVGILVLVLFVWLYRKARDKRELVLYGGTILFFTVVQAIMGALAVVYGQNAPVMALHFGFSLLAFASSFILSMALRSYSRGHQLHASATRKPVSAVFRYSVWFTLFYTYVVVYVGAFVRHTDSTGGCMGWPLCNGEWIPELSGGTLVAFVHRIAAALLFLVVATMAHFAYHLHKGNREIQLYGIWSLVLCLGQVLTGALVVFTLENDDLLLFTGLLHTVFICGMFSVLCYMSIRVWQLRK